MAPVFVSMVANATTTTTRKVDLETLLHEIKDGHWHKQQAAIRKKWTRALKEADGDRKAAKKAIEKDKKRLRGYLVAGTFSRRQNDAWITPSGFMQADIDALGARRPEVRQKLRASPYLFFDCESVIDGLRAIFKIQIDEKPDGELYRRCVEAVRLHVVDLTGIEIDKACKDPARLSFVSSDPHARFNPKAIGIAPVPEVAKEQPEETGSLLEEYNKSQVRDMLAVVPKRPDYPDWIKIVAAVGDALPDSDAIEVLREWSEEETPGEYADKLNHRLKDVHIGSLIRLAKAYGWESEPEGNEQSSAQVVSRRDEWATDLSSFASLDEARFPAPLEEDAYYGLAGRIVQRILPETEADPAALLFSFLTGFGNMLGRNGNAAHMMADGARHNLNLYAITVGRTSISRKGTAWVRARPVLKLVDEDWVSNNVEQGLSSGEGVIHRIRNKIEEERPIKEKGKFVRDEFGEYKHETVTVDPGVDDKRLLIVETEFCSPLKVMNREGNTLSPVLRAAWDGDDLGTLTKNSRERATEPHVSMLGHITKEELRRTLNEVEVANGFGNRNLWVAAKRSKSLPSGGGIPAIADFISPLQDALLFANTCGELRRDAEAEELWTQVYPELAEGEPGLFGAIIARAAPQILRLSGLYAVLDCSPTIRVPHLKAALACWRYCEASARWIFETGTGNKYADRILTALIVAGNTGLTKAQIVHDVFNRNVTKFTIDEALRLLHRLNVATCQKEATGGRPAERWFFQSPHDQNDQNDQKEAE